LSNEELNIQLGHFKNTVLAGPIDFFVKTVEKNYGIKKLTQSNIGESVNYINISRNNVMW
jgi:hypothetical protein